MYQVGDLVIYGIHGVCRVVNQQWKKVDRKPVHYLIVQPLGQAGSSYMIPTYNAAAMARLRRMMSKDELIALIHSNEVRSGQWNRDENQRKQMYRELAGKSDLIPVMNTVYLLYRHKEDQIAAGRRIHQCDDNFLRDAEKLLSGEIAVVMDMTYEEARAYLREQLK